MGIEQKLSKKHTKTLETLKSSGISENFLFYSHYAPVPEILNFSLKMAYQRAGIADAQYHLTNKGEKFFGRIQKLVAQEEAETGIKHLDLPKVGSFDVG